MRNSLLARGNADSFCGCQANGSMAWDEMVKSAIRNTIRLFGAVAVAVAAAELSYN